MYYFIPCYTPLLSSTSTVYLFYSTVLCSTVPFYSVFVYPHYCLTCICFLVSLFCVYSSCVMCLCRASVQFCQVSTHLYSWLSTNWSSTPRSTAVYMLLENLFVAFILSIKYIQQLIPFYLFYNHLCDCHNPTHTCFSRLHLSHISIWRVLCTWIEPTHDPSSYSLIHCTLVSIHSFIHPFNYSWLSGDRWQRMDGAFV